MATDMDRAYHDWSHDEMSNDSQDTSLCHVVDHGSISFGRFAVESLSWEKWSVFSHNRCQEELEKFKAPGLVAQKKAYFEEYYKRIRALKALQQEQEIAPALDSGGNSSVFSKSGEQNTSQDENTISGVRSHSSLSEESIADISVEKETNFKDAPQLQYSVPDSVVPYADSSRSVNDEWTKEIDNNLKNEGSTRKFECSITTAEWLEPESATQATLPEKIESIARRDSNITQENNLCSDQINLDTQRCKDYTSISKGAASSIRNTGRLNHVSVRKETVATSTKNNVRLDRRPKGHEVKTSQGLKHRLHKPGDKTKNSVNSRKETFTKDVGNKNSTSISSNRKLMETHSNIMGPRPFSLSTERRAVGSSSSRDDTPRNSDSKASNRFAELPVNRKSMSRMQNSSMQMDASSHGPLREVPSSITVPRPFTLSTVKRAAAPTSTSDSSAQGHSVSKVSNILVQLPVHKKSVSYMQKTSMEIALKGGMRSTSIANRRSTNLVSSRSNQHRGHEISLSSNDMGKIQNQVKEEPEFRQFRRSSKFTGSLLPSLSKSETSKSEHKKIIPSRCANQKVDGGKSREVMPCWR